MIGRIYSGFPGVGKSTLVANHPEYKDSDSSQFDKAHFPANYITHIKETIQAGNPILVSSHKAVREALVENNLPFVLYYPSRECKEEYLQRYRDRNSPEAFINLLSQMWDTWITECEEWPGDKVEMVPNSYLDDYLNGLGLD